MINVRILDLSENYDIKIHNLGQLIKLDKFILADVNL